MHVLVFMLLMILMRLTRLLVLPLPCRRVPGRAGTRTAS